LWPDQVAFAQLRGALGRSLYGVPLATPGALARALDRAGSGGVSAAEFGQGCERLGLGLGRAQVRRPECSRDHHMAVMA
jgi:hypothetical protein